jgi:ATP phosphoribosyltransferase regulatory subunit HisZ
LCKLKIKYTEDIRDRVERICIKSEIAFAKRLPDGQKLVEMAESKLKRPKSFYTDVQHQQRNLDALAELGKKNWLARILYRVAKRKADKRNARLISDEND